MARRAYQHNGGRHASYGIGVGISMKRHQMQRNGSMAK